MSAEANRKQDETEKGEATRYVNKLPIIALIGAVVTLICYTVGFSDQPISTDTGAWGAFGDYYQGMLNPLIQILLLMAVVKTYNLQRSELSETKDALQNQWKLDVYRTEREEVYKAIEAIQKKLEDAFMKPEVVIETQGDNNYKPQPFSKLFGQYKNIEIYDALTGSESLKGHADYISDLFYNLGEMMYEYEHIDNPTHTDINHNRTAIIRYYKTIWEPAVKDMNAKGFLKRPESVGYYKH